MMKMWARKDEGVRFCLYGEGRINKMWGWTRCRTWETREKGIPRIYAEPLVKKWGTLGVCCGGVIGVHLEVC